jgi:hypothetical protein
MRNKGRLGVALALAATMALAAAGSAIATTSSVKFNVTPSKKLGSAGKPAKLFVNTHSDYATGSFAGSHTNRTQLYFDKNILFKQSVVPKCPAAKVSGNLTLKQAMAKCGKTLVGSGTAQANAIVPGDSKACVLAFNRKPNGILIFTRVQINGPINCAKAATNTNGTLSILLQAPLKSNPAKTTPGGKLPPAYYKGGKWLDFNNITNVAALPLRDFKVTTGKGSPQTKLTGGKANFLRAKCTKRPGLGAPSKKWVMRYVFTYNNGPGQPNLPKRQAGNAKKGPCT